MKVNKKYLYNILLFTFLLFLKLILDLKHHWAAVVMTMIIMHSETIALDRDLNYSNQLKGNEDKRFSFNGKIAPTSLLVHSILNFHCIFRKFHSQHFRKHRSKSSKILNFRILFYSLSSITYFLGLYFWLRKPLTF